MGPGYEYYPEGMTELKLQDAQRGEFGEKGAVPQKRKQKGGGESKGAT